MFQHNKYKSKNNGVSYDAVLYRREYIYDRKLRKIEEVKSTGLRSKDILSLILNEIQRRLNLLNAKINTLNYVITDVGVGWFEISIISEDDFWFHNVDLEIRKWRSIIESRGFRVIREKNKVEHKEDFYTGKIYAVVKVHFLIRGNKNEKFD